jgi:IS5 family transposase
LFRRLAGLDIAENVPDHSTLWSFRQKLIGGPWEMLLKEINDQLNNRQLYIIDAARARAWSDAEVAARWE